MKQNLNPQKRKTGTIRANKGEAIRDLTKGRICSVCNKYKERQCFFAHPSGFNRLGPRCKECFSIFGKTPKSKRVKKFLYDKRKENKECVKCGNLELVTNVHCRNCWFVDRICTRGGGMKNMLPLQKLWDQQQGRCFYTNEILIPGKNASLDHQIPESRGGSSEPDNFRWINNNINLMKSDMTHNEFINMCKYIASRF